jgi:hypothetical protein
MKFVEGQGVAYKNDPDVTMGEVMYTRHPYIGVKWIYTNRFNEIEPMLRSTGNISTSLEDAQELEVKSNPDHDYWPEHAGRCTWAIPGWVRMGCFFARMQYYGPPKNRHPIDVHEECNALLKALRSGCRRYQSGSCYLRIRLRELRITMVSLYKEGISKIAQ